MIISSGRGTGKWRRVCANSLRPVRHGPDRCSVNDDGASAACRHAADATIERDSLRAEGLGLTAAEVRRRWPCAVEYVGLDGNPCRRLEDLTDSFQDDGEEGEP
jgi:hypothetical protein